MTYASHKLEDRILCELEKLDHIFQALPHRILISVCPDHAAVETVSKAVVNIEFGWCTRCEEGIVESCKGQSMRKRRRG